METTAATPSPVTSFSLVYAHYSGSPESDKHRDMMVDSMKTIYPGITVYESEYRTPKYMMIERPNIYAEARKHIRGPLLFLDTDIVAMRPAPMAEILAQPFDVAVVPGRMDGNDYNLMPWCGGLQLWQDTPKALEYSQIVARAATNIPEGMIVDGWWADQLALAYGIWHTPELRYMQLPPKLYNFVPESAQSTMAFFVHLKGPRKHLMRQYYNGVKRTDHTGF